MSAIKHAGDELARAASTAPDTAPDLREQLAADLLAGAAAIGALGTGA